MRIVHDIYSPAQSVVSGMPYRAADGQKPQHWKANITISAPNPNDALPELLEIEGTGQHLIALFEAVLEALRVIQDSYVEDGEILPPEPLPVTEITKVDSEP